MKPLQLTLIAISFFFLSCSEKNTGKAADHLNDLYELGYDFREDNKPDSAFKYFSLAKEQFIQENDSLGAAKCLVNMGIIATNKGDFYGGQEFSLNAISYLDTTKVEQYPHIASNFNNLGEASRRLIKLKEAIHFYEQALKYNGTPSEIVVIKNNIANAYDASSDYKKAIAIYEDLLKKPLNSTYYPKVLTNLAFSKWHQDSSYNAAPELLKALELRKEVGDPLEQNQSYAYLTKYYTSDRPDSALLYALKMYDFAKIARSANDQLQALQSLIRLSPANEEKKFVNRYFQLDDSVEVAFNTSKNEFALIRYETEKNKQDLFKSRAANAEKENDILKRNIAVGILAVGLILGYLFYIKRKKGLQQEKELEVKNTELKYTRKIHDHVANKVYHIMSELENVDELDKNGLLDKLEAVYEISRDISYETKELLDEQFAIKVSTMLNSYASKEVKVKLKGNDEQLWERSNENARAEVFCILQELMTNMSKHSEAKIVELTFKQKEGFIHIDYVDNGKGMKSTAPKNGLKNTETRIQSILGSITFDKETDKGLKIRLSFPLN